MAHSSYIEAGDVDAIHLVQVKAQLYYPMRVIISSRGPWKGGKLFDREPISDPCY
jgi:hypothetical protein